MTPQDVERAAQLYGSGLTIDEVVKQIGYSSSTIQSAASERRCDASRTVSTDDVRAHRGISARLS
jgi:hypothetical protein